MGAETTLFRQLQRRHKQVGSSGAQLQEKVEHMDTVARDIIERGGTTDAEEFIFAIHGLTRAQRDGSKVIRYYNSVEQTYDESAVGKIFIRSSISMQTKRQTESPVYYVAERPMGNSDDSKWGLAPLEYQIEQNDKLPPSTYVGRIVVPNVLVIQDSIKSVSLKPDVAVEKFELKRFMRFVGQDGQAPVELFGIPPIASPLWELAIVTTLSHKDRGIVDMGDVAAYASGLNNARNAFRQFEAEQHQNQMIQSV